MVQVEVQDLCSIVEQGVRGSSASVALLARRLASRLKKSDPEAAARLASVLSAESVVRERITTAMPVDRDSRSNLLHETAPVVLEVEPQWSPDVQSILDSVLRERRAAARLIEAGLEPVRAVLFKGPPGVGKTLAARWLARELKVPLLTLDLASVMSSLLGKTGSNIKAVIDYAKGFPCVLLLDEFDAIAKKRDDDRDVGELKRLVTVLLQAIDEWPATSLLVAATNHPDLLDPAVWRRFDRSVDFGVPPLPVIVDLLIRAGVSESISPAVASAIKGESFATIGKILSAAKKSVVLDGQELDEAVIREALSSEAAGHSGSSALRNIQIMELAMRGLSQRKIAQQLGVSHPTVGRVMKQVNSGGKT